MSRKKTASPKEPVMDLSTFVIFLMNLVETYSLGVPVAYLPEGRDLEKLRPGKRGALLFFTLVQDGKEDAFAMRLYMLRREGAYAPTAAEVLAAISTGLSTTGRLLAGDVYFKAEPGKNQHLGTQIDDADLEKVKRPFDTHVTDLLLHVETLKDPKSAEDAAG
jgi:hypothetical protein